ncbi:MAG: manganese oxidase [Verrucomicrobiota bacterium]
MRYRNILRSYGAIVLLAFALGPPAWAKESPIICNRTIKVQVVALDQPWMWNRLGAAQPGGMIYALARDVVTNMDGSPLPDDLKNIKDPKSLCGGVRLRDDKRARPLVLRANKGDCLEITFLNLLKEDPVAADNRVPTMPKGVPGPTRWAGIHAAGMELVGDISSDSSRVGNNPSSLAENGQTKIYKWYAAEEGTFLIYSAADMESGYQAKEGLFGAIHVEPEGAEWYRSQITHDELDQATLTEADLKKYSQELVEAPVAADPPPKTAEKIAPTAEKPPPGAENFTKKTLESHVADKRSSVTVFVDEKGAGGKRIHTATGQPRIYYNAVYPAKGQKPGAPVLQMLQVNPVGAALYDQPLQKQNPADYIEELTDLDAGIIPAKLRAIFKEKKQELSAGAKVVEQYRYSWLITDEGKAFYVTANLPSTAQIAQARQLQIFKAELELIYSDLTAVITGPNAGRFSYANTSPTFRENPASPDRRQPYREYTIIYHQAFFATQSFASFANSNLVNVIQPGADNFAINYGSAAIGPEIVANRLGVGPMGNRDAVDLKFEEFFLSAWAVGDPAMVVDHPANASNAMVGNPDEHRALRTQVPPGSVSAQLAAALVPPQPRPEQVSAPVTDDYAPLPAPPIKATKAFFPADPSNVYHSYMNDHVKFRILHAGPGPSHVHHLHAHQWLRSPDSDNGHYLDSQLIVPGSAFTLEITYNGSGNRNKTVGDAIFHCHFYPHFAQGMWALWRVHDVFEGGTLLDKNGVPLSGVNRALPDGEIEHGTPIPAIVPLPTLGMAPMPAEVELTDLSPWSPGGQGRRVLVHKEKDGTYRSPGYPFFIPGVSGHRPPHPPLDFAWLEEPDTGKAILSPSPSPDPSPGKDRKIYLDGGLPRHLVLDGKVVKEFHTRWDFSKDTALRDKDENIIPGGELSAFQLPEEGTPVELAAMKEHATRTRPTTQPNGDPGNFILNGLPPTPGAPYADPAVTDEGNANPHRRRYQAAVFQIDTVLNKKGWHYPQQRMISLWQDVKPTVDTTRPPQPFFFRTNTSDSIQYWHTNLLPSYYQLDDFQVRTPTDIVGQHIHLVKFDVTSSDGAENGFNYEDGTYAPDEVQERISSINAKGGLFAFDPATGFVNKAAQQILTLKKVKDYYPPPDSKFAGLDANGVPTWTNPNPNVLSVFGPPTGVHSDAWDGAQTTIQLWEVDALLNNEGVDRTLRTVFTHDHFGPSTHQQAGLYAGMIVEPENSEWYLPDGLRMNTRLDGGPTSWHGYIVTDDPRDSYREFILEFQDMQLAYTKQSRKKPSAKMFDPDPDLKDCGSDPKKEPCASPAFDIAQANSNPSLKTTYLPLYVADLDQSKLPVPPPQAIGAAPFTELFPQFGIPLSKKATVAVVTKGEKWTITEAANEINGSYSGKPGTKYIVRALFEAQSTTGGKTIKNLLVYTPDISPGWADGKFALNPPGDNENAVYGGPFAQIVSQNQFGTYSLNYRNEPVPFRVNCPPNMSDNADLALAFSSIPRSDPDLNLQPDGKPGFPKTPLVPNAKGTDPYTPLLEAYANDRVQIRTLVGAHTQAHAFQVQGVKWLYEPDNPNSGWRNAQLMGLSEHYEMLFDLPGTVFKHGSLPAPPLPPFADYFYSPSSDIVGLNNGLWGIMRAYGAPVPGVQPLPNNPKIEPSEKDLFKEGYEKAPTNLQQPYDVTAVTADVLTDKDPLKNGSLVYNGRDPGSQLSTNEAVLYVRTKDLAPDGKSLKKGVTVEPLILRAAAGQWIKVTLHNGLDVKSKALTDVQTLPYGTPFTGGPDAPQPDMKTSAKVGLHPQLVGYDPVNANGVLVGFNPKDQLVDPGKTRDFYWYAGELKRGEDGKIQAKPIEFGATNLTSADQLLQPQFGMVGALIIEPEGSTWVEDVSSRASATVTVPFAPGFREFVVIDQNMVANSAAGNSVLAGVAGSTVGAINYRSEPFGIRGLPSNAQNFPQPAPAGYSLSFSNQMFNPPSDPQTPVFVAAAGTSTRFRMLVPSTATSNAINAPPVFIVHGHHWQEEPYIFDSSKIGDNPLSETQGAVQGGVGQKFDLVFPSAGGRSKVAGDYLYTTYQTASRAGTWGVFRVTAAKVVIEKVALEKGIAQVSGAVEAVGEGSLPRQLRISLATDADGAVELGTTPVAPDGRWTFTAKTDRLAPARIEVAAMGEDGTAGATATIAIPAPLSIENYVMQRENDGAAFSP